MPLSRGRFMPVCIEIGSFVSEVQRSQVGNRRANERTDRRTDGWTGREHYASGQSRLTYRYIQYMFAVVIAFVCFYHVERILSAIAKIFVHHLGKGGAA